MTTESKLSFDDTAVAFATKSDAELLKMYTLFAAMNNNFLVKKGGNLVQRAFKWGLPVKFVVKPTIFQHFCGGENLLECNQAIQSLGKANVGTILDYSVEGENNENSFDRTTKEVLATIEKANTSQFIPFSVFKVSGIADSRVLEKVQANEILTPQEEKAYARARNRMETLCHRAHQYGVAILVDAEESWFQEVIDTLTYEMMAKYNREKAIVYNTYQLYRHDRLEVLQRDYQKAVQHNYFIGAKLVRGAYMEKEARRAAEQGYSNPINSTKEASDALFNEALTFCVEHLDRIAICAGTHNEASSYLLVDLMEKHGITPNDKRIYFAQLYGMSDNLSYNLAHAGYNVAKYVPYGPVEAVIPYLLRRAEENTAIAGQSSREFNLIKKEMQRRKALKSA
ncbi:proline dehydrogenase family protein [Adhaeribacter pallidiroseus]|uniref:Carbapenem antibiotics biosynthesis protein CarD n=1 Tax=Adhaeribacter pallidiroseus TaxID=2072847 RepID=A0A369QGN0_9BACT|nr:proline dehydrogenase family protein [Adhaeribacter pallidiroseus]RDC62386.1 Carbapenem antibiotics biosynthesis protein CarD [Adhaeribacter pallidiroseus]